MKSKFYFALVLICMFQLLSCKKDPQQAQQVQQQQNVSLEKAILNFSVNGQLVDAVIDTSTNTITITVPNSANLKSIAINFNLANQLTAAVNNKTINSGTILDLSNPVMFMVKSADNMHSASFKLMAQTELGYFGLYGTVVSQKSLNRDYEFYFDQFDGSPFSNINCGPTSSTMAIKWADSTFTKKPRDARALISPGGGWWTTGNISSYLSTNGIQNVTDTLSNLDSLVKKSIDHNNPLILCLDMFYVPQNGIGYQHTQKFYFTNAPNWGHFILIKGYIQLNNDFYLDAYDPYSNLDRYSTLTVGQLMGKDRYYRADDIRIATNIWWPYAIVLAQKGQTVTASTKLQLNSLGKQKPIPVAYGR